MGRVEKQIIAGALALVAIFLSVVVYKGIKEPEDPGDSAARLVTTDYPELETPPLAAAGRGETAGAAEPAASGRAGTAGLVPAPASSRPKTAPAGANREAPPLVIRPAQAVPEVARELDYDPELVPYQIRAGDTLSEIAVRELGSVEYQGDILALNETLDSEALKVGQFIWLPSRHALTPAKPQARETAERKPVSAEGKPQLRADAVGRRHVVAAGENLWKISSRYYGSGKGVDWIVEANAGVLRSRNDVLRIGMVLQIPEKR